MHHVGGNPPTNASHARGIDSAEKTRRIGCKPKPPYKICKGDHLTHLCPTIPEIQQVWSLFECPSNLESTLVSQQSIQPLVNEVIDSMQSLTDPTLLLGDDVSNDNVVPQLIQLVV
jgi:hypothetical protein